LETDTALDSLEDKALATKEHMDKLLANNRIRKVEMFVISLIVFVMQIITGYKFRMEKFSGFKVTIIGFPKNCATDLVKLT